MPVRKSYSKELIARIPAGIERTQALISNDPEQSLRILIDIVKPWMETMVSRRPYVCQQDGAPVHTSHLIQNWLSDNIDMFWSKELWPPNNPDLNSLDYTWSIIERVS